MMSKVCIPNTQGGKGNRGMFIERDPKIFAAGKPTAQGTECVGDHLQHYLLKDEVDSLINDAIIPVQKPPTRQFKNVDMRNAGPFTEARDLINPPNETKFKSLVKELKSTVYASFWKQPVGRSRDPLPMLPGGTNIYTKTMGMKTKDCGNLYDLVMPKEPITGSSPPSMNVGYKTDRKYSRPAYNPDMTFGITSKPGKWGEYVKCCLSDREITGGGFTRYIRVAAEDADFKEYKHAKIGVAKTPINNIECVPPGFTFGELKPPENFYESLTSCELNAGRKFLRECLSHLNTARKLLSKRFDANFFRKFYLKLKYLDEDKLGWLPKQVLYDKCTAELVRFNPALIEPLLELWGAFDGSQIEYKKFIHIINFREALPTLPKILDIAPECVQYTTTYKDMVAPGQEADNRLMAGLPSGRYFDKDYPVTPEGCIKAHRICLPEESDARSCLNPSALTVLGVNHRDMYAKRTPEQVRSVFEKSGLNMSDEKFNLIWEEAKQYHSQGWVCFETFKRAFDNIHADEVKSSNKTEENDYL